MHQNFHRAYVHFRGLGIVQGKRIVSVSRDGTMRVWDLETGECEHVLEGHADNVHSIAVHGNIIISGGYDKTARLWDATTGQQLQLLEGHGQKISSVASDGKLAISGSLDSSIRIWSVENGYVVLECGFL